MENFPDHIKRIAHVMEQCQMNQTDLARTLGITRQGLDSILRRHGKPSFDVLEKMRSVLGVDLNWMVTGEGDSWDKKILTLPELRKKEEELKAKKEDELKVERLHTKLALMEKDLSAAKMEVDYLKRLLAEKEKQG